jgi:hypothetical protein
MIVVKLILEGLEAQLSSLVYALTHLMDTGSVLLLTSLSLKATMVNIKESLILNVNKVSVSL